MHCTLPLVSCGSDGQARPRVRTHSETLLSPSPVTRPGPWLGLGLYVMAEVMAVVMAGHTGQPTLLIVTVIIIIIEGLSLLQSIPPTTANKQTQAQKKRGSMARKMLGANAKSYRLKLKLRSIDLMISEDIYTSAHTLTSVGHLAADPSQSCL